MIGLSTLVVVLALVSAALPVAGAGTTSQSAQTPRKLPPPTTQDFIAEKVIAMNVARSIEHHYAADSPTLTPGHSWPLAVTLNRGRLTGDDGQALTLVPSQFLLTYTPMHGGTAFEVSVWSFTNTGSVKYVSSTDSLTEFCSGALCPSSSNS